MLVSDDYFAETGFRLHYGTPDGPACGAHIKHEGLTRMGDVLPVTCRRCRRTSDFLAAIGECPHPRRWRSYIARGNFRCLRCGFSLGVI